jgi:Asp-tRNA(Asn)/Glu-tRNA(Gln) amidotransferase C subunit
MKIKIITFAILILNIALFSGIAFSQQNEKVKKTPEEFAQKRAERMKESLSLTEVQYKQVYDMFLSKAQERKSNKEKYKDLDKTARKELKKQNREKFQSQLNEILNTDQIAKLNEMKSKHKGKKNKGKNKDKNDKRYKENNDDLK